jgi:hypothetical protein
MTASALAAGLIDAARAEPASPDAAFTSMFGAHATLTTITELKAAGATLSLTARGQTTSVDCQDDLDRLEDARAMQGFLPGYPQPARLTVGVRLAF